MNEKSIEQVLREDGKFVCTTSGVSMMPLFADRRDTVIILPARGRLKKYDVPLYRRGDEYVLHRIIKVKKDSYVIRGDNCEVKEVGISDEDIIGILSAFYRKDKYCDCKALSYRIYSVLIVAFGPALVFCRRVRRRLCRIFANR